MFSRISTKDLYIAECVSFYDKDKNKIYFEHFNPRHYIMVRKTGKYHIQYIDVFTKTAYQLVGDCFAERGTTVVYDIIPITKHKSYITKRYAKELLKRLNSQGVK